MNKETREQELRKEIERIEIRIKEFQSKLLFDGEWEGCCRILECLKAELKGHTQAIKKVQEKIAKLKCGLEDYDEALTDLNDILVEEAKLSEGAK